MNEFSIAQDYDAAHVWASNSTFQSMPDWMNDAPMSSEELLYNEWKSQNDITIHDIGLVPSSPISVTAIRNDIDPLSFFDTSNASFVRIKPNGKAPIEADWQHKPHNANKGRDWLAAGYSIGALCGEHSDGLIMIDLDCQADQIMAHFPVLARLPFIYRENAQSIKLLIRSSEPLDNQSFETIWINPAKDKPFHFHLLSDGKQGVIPPSIHESGTPYRLDTNGYELIPIWLASDIMAAWNALKAACGVQKTPKPVKDARPRPVLARSVASQTVQHGDGFDWTGFTRDVEAAFDLESYAVQHFGEARREKDGSVRILGNGGLIIAPCGTKWVNHSSQEGGGPFQLVSLRINGDTNTRNDWLDILKEAAVWAGVGWPDFEVAKQDQGPKKEKGADGLTYEYHDFVGWQVVDFLDGSEGNAFIIDPDTGHGKTTAIEEVSKSAILAMPMTSQCKQREAKGASFAVYEGISTHDVPPDWRNIATTYNSLPRVMASHGFVCEVLALDEIHHFLTDAYRQGAIRDAYRTIKGFDGLKILMSATPMADVLTQTIFPEFKHVVCRDVGMLRPKRNIPIIATDGGIVDYALQIARDEIVNGIYFPNNGVIICHVNDKTNILASIDHINKIVRNVGRAYGFTADTKEEDHHEMMIIDGKLPDDCRFLFTTSLINDSFSFGPRANVVLVSRQSSLMPHEFVQLTARWRDELDMALPHALIIFKREPDKKPMNLDHDGPLLNNAIIEEYHKRLEGVEIQLELAIAQREAQEEAKKRLASNSKALDDLQRTIEKTNAAYTHLTFKMDSIEIDYIGLLQSCVEANRHMSTGQLIREIEEYGGFHFVTKNCNASDETNTIKEALIALKADERASKKEQFANVIEVARDEGIQLLKDILDSLKQYPDLYPDGTIEAARSVMSLWRLIEKDGGDFDRLLDVVIERKITSKSRANKLAQKIRTAKIVGGVELLADLAGGDHASAKASLALAKLLSMGTVLTSEKVKQIRGIMEGIDGADMIGRWECYDKTLKSIKNHFETKRIKIKNKDEKWVNAWEVKGLFDLLSIRKNEEIKRNNAKPIKEEQSELFSL